MSRTDFHEKINKWLLMSIAFTMPFSIRINSLLIILCSVNLIASGKIISRIKALITNKIIVTMLLFFFIHIISVCVSNNQKEALAIIERRLSFVVFPFLLFNIDAKVYFNAIIRAFILGVFIALSVCFAFALNVYIKTGGIEGFFYHKFSDIININAVYLSCYTVFAIFLLLIENVMEQKFKILKHLLLVFLCIMCVLLNSKLMLAMLLFGLLFSLFRNTIIDASRKKLLILFVLLITLSLFFIPNVKSRFKAEFSTHFEVVGQQRYNYDTPFSGTSLRLVIWKYSYEIMKESKAWLFGIGTGDFQDELNKKYKSSNMYTGNPELHDTGYLGYGPHNQYIETFLSMGLIGLVLMGYLIYHLISYFIKVKDSIALFFSILVSSFLITESAISTQKGIVFFVFFSVLFLSRNSFNTTNIA